jgi:hypothetical protein
MRLQKKWRTIRTTFLEASENVLGFKEKNKKDCLTQQTWERSENEKGLKTR